MQKWHPALPAAEPHLSGPKQATLSLLGIKAIPKKLPPRSECAQIITKGIASFIAKDMRPITTIEGEGFKELLSTLEQAYEVPCWKTVTQLLTWKADD